MAAFSIGGKVLALALAVAVAACALPSPTHGSTTAAATTETAIFTTTAAALGYTLVKRDWDCVVNPISEWYGARYTLVKKDWDCVSTTSKVQEWIGGTTKMSPSECLAHCPGGFVHATWGAGNCKCVDLETCKQGPPAFSNLGLGLYAPVRYTLVKKDWDVFEIPSTLSQVLNSDWIATGMSPSECFNDCPGGFVHATWGDRNCKCVDLETCKQGPPAFSGSGLGLYAPVGHTATATTETSITATETAFTATETAITTTAAAARNTTTTNTTETAITTTEMATTTTTPPDSGAASVFPKITGAMFLVLYGSV